MLRLRILATLAATACVAAATATHYLRSGDITAPDKLWDYASVDPSARRLYVAGFGGVTTVDLASGRVVPDLIRSKLVHDVAPLPNGLAAATNGEDASVTLFNGATGAVVATIPVGNGPDGISVDARRGWLIVTEEDGDSLSLIDPVRRRVIKRIALGGAPEAAVSDASGTVFDNMGERPEIAVVDPDRGVVVKRIPLPGCDAPTGIAYDRRSDVILSVCRNGSVEIVSAKSRAVRKVLRVGAGPDAVMVDSRRGRFFVPSGATGELNVFQANANGDVYSVEHVPTEIGSRTGAVDPSTGTVYVPAATLMPPTQPGMRHSIKPGSFHILAFSPA